MTETRLLTFRSVTAAMNALRRLQRAQIPAQLRRSGRVPSSGGCGYALQISAADVRDALFILRRERFDFGKLLRRDAQGHWTEETP